MGKKGERKLYLRESRARHTYSCALCSSLIRRGTVYYRDEPFPMDHMRGTAEVRLLCFGCVAGKSSENLVARLRTRSVIEPFQDEHQLILPLGEEAIIHRTYVQLVNVTAALAERILNDYEEIYRIDPESFEYLIQDRLCAMGMEAERVSHTFRKDGGVDIVFWPRKPFPIPFLGAAQLKHHRSPLTKTGPAVIRELAGVLHRQPFNFGIVVTNTTFTPDAQWFASQEQTLIRLRDMSDLKRWVASNFTDDAEWRELPSELELCPGVKINLTRRIFRKPENV